MKEPILRITDLHYTYPNKVHVLKGISLEIERGQRVAVMGSNGSGKTTFFLCLNGVLKPQHGNIYFAGKKVDSSKKSLLELKKNVGIVFQDPDSQLFLPIVEQEIAFGVMNLRLPEDRVMRQVDDVIKKLELKELRHQPTHFLSYGQKKRVSIADVLVMEPQVIIMDEPTASLDPKYAGQVDRIIEDLSSKGMTMLVSTHDVDRASAWADQVIVFHDGQICAAGPPEQIFSDRKLLEKANLARPLILQLFDELQDYGVLPEGIKAPKDKNELVTYLKKYTAQNR